MAILDTFYIMFKGDSSSAERALERVDRSANRLDSSLNRVARRWLSLYAIINQATHALKYAFDLTEASQQLGVNTSALETWGGVVQKTGGTLSSFTKTLETLAEKLGTTPKIALQSLPVLAAQFERLNRAQAVKYGKVLGLDLPTILLLQKGRAEVDALVKRQQELGTITEKDAGTFRRFRSELQDTGHGIQYIFLQMALKVLPVINNILHAIQDFTIHLQKHSGLIKGALIPITAAVTAFAASFILANPIFYGAITALGLLAAAFALVYDDIQVFQRGGISVTGDFINRFPLMTAVIKDALQGVKLFFKGILWIFDVLANDIETVLSALKMVGSWVAPYISGAFKGMKLEGDFDLNSAKRTIELANTSPLGSAGMKSAINNSLSNKSTTIAIEKIEVNTQATDATEIAYGLGNALQNQFRQAQNEFSGGVMI
jgi:hypothetical protein